MEEPQDPEALAGRIDTLLGELRGDARAGAVAEELVRTLMLFYGAAFARTLDLVAADARPVIDTLAADPLVGSVMLLHDLHPVDRERRVADALDRARAIIDDPDATLSLNGSQGDRLRLQITGLPAATAATYRKQVLRVMRDALPELADIDFDDLPPPVAILPLQLCRADGTPVPIPPAAKQDPAAGLPEERIGT